jgi:hypothetical protein
MPYKRKMRSGPRAPVRNRGGNFRKRPRIVRTTRTFRTKYRTQRRRLSAFYKRGGPRAAPKRKKIPRRFQQRPVTKKALAVIKQKGPEMKRVNWTDEYGFLENAKSYPEEGRDYTEYLLRPFFDYNISQLDTINLPYLPSIRGEGVFQAGTFLRFAKGNNDNNFSINKINVADNEKDDNADAMQFEWPGKGNNNWQREGNEIVPRACPVEFTFTAYFADVGTTDEDCGLVNYPSDTSLFTYTNIAFDSSATADAYSDQLKAIYDGNTKTFRPFICHVIVFQPTQSWTNKITEDNDPVDLPCMTDGTHDLPFLNSEMKGYSFNKSEYAQHVFLDKKMLFTRPRDSGARNVYQAKDNGSNGLELLSTTLCDKIPKGSQHSFTIDFAKMWPKYLRWDDNVQVPSVPSNIGDNYIMIFRVYAAGRKSDTWNRVTDAGALTSAQAAGTYQRMLPMGNTMRVEARPRGGFTYYDP